jgi:hypothetical protein
VVVVVVVRVVERGGGRDDDHPDIGHPVVHGGRLAHGGSGGGGRRAPEARGAIEAEGEVVPACGGGGGDPVREGAGVNWEAPSRSHTSPSAAASSPSCDGRLLLVMCRRLLVVRRPICSGIAHRGIPSPALRRWRATRRTRQHKGGHRGVGFHGVRRGSRVLRHFRDQRHGLSLPV